jgi:hypothetical protein
LVFFRNVATNVKADVSFPILVDFLANSPTTFIVDIDQNNLLATFGSESFDDNSPNSCGATGYYRHLSPQTMQTCHDDEIKCDTASSRRIDVQVSLFDLQKKDFTALERAVGLRFGLIGFNEK